MKLRHVTSADFHLISPLLNEWWSGRTMTDMLPKLFFDHFQDTSFIIEKNGGIIGFLIGFLSQSKKGEAYIHFVGVHPDYRKNKVGHELYEEFFKIVMKHGCHTVRCITSPVNTGSIQFHLKMGFEILSGDKTVNGIQVKTNYDGENKDRVQFVKRLSLEETE
ncbi:GNAT family N-acetyltransferase [Bacillus idriensis]|uniref:GNAT family N-acetyltransferase n=1 Tax=Metabacillus idriensis TaxID=324768 RepID=A0A6I2MHD1_9BACI|nr:GNAT family N-acetyltransferase [Metabacillus idriensis]MRX55861.1 GNAT family N-acetyltransferase [Metabacillus idriensis]